MTVRPHTATLLEWARKVQAIAQNGLAFASDPFDRERYTQLIAEGLTPIRRWGTPADVGRAVAALVTGAIPFSTGDVLNVDGGFHLRRFPV